MLDEHEIVFNFPNSQDNEPKAQFRRRTFHEPTQINKSTPVDSDAELNSPNLIQFEPKPLVKKPKTETACKIRYKNLCIRFGT